MSSRLLYDNPAVSIFTEMKDFFVNKNVTNFAVSNVFGDTFSPLIVDLVKNIIIPVISVLFFKFGKNSLNYNFMGKELKFGQTLSNIFIFIMSMVILFFLFVRPVNISIQKEEMEKQKERQERLKREEKSLKTLDKILSTLKNIEGRNLSSMNLKNVNQLY